MRLHKQNDGFTIIELLIVTIVIGILLTLVLTTYSGVQAKNRNSTRQSRIDTLQAQLETYYAQYSKYPTLAEVNSTSWVKANLKDMPSNTLSDPHWNKDNKNCTVAGMVVLSNAPAENCFAYQVTASDGSVCDNVKALCAQYTLTSKLEGGSKYVKGSLN
jgi:prepilin-type N-terminal cleavage/methylation domain-containing protein